MARVQRVKELSMLKDTSVHLLRLKLKPNLIKPKFHKFLMQVNTPLPHCPSEIHPGGNPGEKRSIKVRPRQKLYPKKVTPVKYQGIKDHPSGKFTSMRKFYQLKTTRICDINGQNANHITLSFILCAYIINFTFYNGVIQIA